MKMKSLALAATLALAGTLAPSAFAQDKVQFFPSLTGRTGPVAPNATPFANGYADYMKLVNARGGINGVMTLVEECETAYATDRGVECYERLKGKHGGATVFQPLSTGITFALTEKLPNDKIPMITSGYGRSDSQDGSIFKWNFPLIGHYWVAGDVVLQHIAKKEGGWDKLRGKKNGLSGLSERKDIVVICENLLSLRSFGYCIYDTRVDYSIYRQCLPSKAA